jgi:Uncharacterized protein conserved in bacteria
VVVWRTNLELLLVALTQSPMNISQKNLMGGPLLTCGLEPATGVLRDGKCCALPGDVGAHWVCAQVTENFLEYSRRRGNDLVTPRPEFSFPGLKPGDNWCLCLSRWLEAMEAGCAPLVVFESTNLRCLKLVDLSIFQKHRLPNNPL